MQIVNRRTAVWRRVFLCSQTALLTLVGLLTLDLRRHHTAIEGTSRVLSLLEGGFLLLECFLLFASPFFFRRLGMVALTAFLAAVTGWVWMVVPVF